MDKENAENKNVFRVHFLLQKNKSKFKRLFVSGNIGYNRAFFYCPKPAEDDDPKHNTLIT